MRIRRIIDGIELGITRAWDVLIFALLWAVIVTLTWKQYTDADERYKSWGSRANESTDYDKIDRGMAERFYEDARLSSQETDAKLKYMVALSGVASASIGAFSTSKFGGLWGPAAYVMYAGFFATLILAVAAFGRRTETVPMPETTDAEYVHGLLIAATRNRAAAICDVDLFVAARRWLIVAIVALLVGVLVPTSKGEPPVDAHSARAPVSNEPKIGCDGGP